MYKMDLNRDWQVRSEELAWGPVMSHASLVRQEGVDRCNRIMLYVIQIFFTGI